MCDCKKWKATQIIQVKGQNGGKGAVPAFPAHQAWNLVWVTRENTGFQSIEKDCAGDGCCYHNTEVKFFASHQATGGVQKTFLVIENCGRKLAIPGRSSNGIWSLQPCVSTTGALGPGQWPKTTFLRLYSTVTKRAVGNCPERRFWERARQPSQI